MMVGIFKMQFAYLKCKRQHLGGKGDYKSIEENPMEDETLQKTTNEQKLKKSREFFTGWQIS